MGAGERTIPRTPEALSRRASIRLVVGGALAGLAAGLVVACYRQALHWAEGLLHRVTGVLGTSVWGALLWVAILVLLALIVSQICRRVPFVAGSGIPQIEARVIGVANGPWRKVGPAKFLSGTLCCLGGLSLGREGPSVQLGGLCGQAVGNHLTSSDGERRLLVTCGAGAGMAAAFQAPLTGVMFTIEEIHRAFSAPLVIATMSSCVAAVMVVTGLFGAKPVLPMGFSRELPHMAYGMVALLGVVSGLAGWLFDKGMERGQRAMEWLGRRLPFDPMVAVFALAAPVAFLMPALCCGGDGLIDLVEGASPMALTTLLGLLLAKYLLTNVATSSGAPGGTLYPLVVMGMVLGCTFATVAVAAGVVDPGYYWNFALLGVAGLFSSVIQAPVTGCVLVFELTGNLSALLSLALVALVSYLVVALLGAQGYYERLLGELLEKVDGSGTKEGGVGALRLVVGCGSIMDGLTIQQVTWPVGCAPVAVERAGAPHSAHGSWQLQCGDELTLWVDRSELGEVQGTLEFLSTATPEDQQPLE